MRVKIFASSRRIQDIRNGNRLPSHLNIIHTFGSSLFVTRGLRRTLPPLSPSALLPTPGVGVEDDAGDAAPPLGIPPRPGVIGPSPLPIATPGAPTIGGATPTAACCSPGREGHTTIPYAVGRPVGPVPVGPLVEPGVIFVAGCADSPETPDWGSEEVVIGAGAGDAELPSGPGC